MARYEPLRAQQLPPDRNLRYGKRLIVTVKLVKIQHSERLLLPYPLREQAVFVFR